MKINQGEDLFVAQNKGIRLASDFQGIISIYTFEFKLKRSQRSLIKRIDSLDTGSSVEDIVKHLVVNKITAMELYLAI